MSQTIKTPHLRNVRNLANLSSYGVKYHMHINGLKDGVRETVHVAIPVDWNVVALSHDYFTVSRSVKGEDIHFTYSVNGSVISVGLSDAITEMEAEGYTDCYLVSDYLLLMLTPQDIKYGVRKGMLEAGA
jgi:hypothetical protein